MATHTPYTPGGHLLFLYIPAKARSWGRRDLSPKGGSMHYFPLTLPFLLMFALFIVFLVLFIEIGLLTYAYERIGVGRRHMFALLGLSFLGSYINIPVYELAPHAVESGQISSFGGMLYVIPEVTNWPATIIAVNVGGAVIPTLLSFFL